MININLHTQMPSNAVNLFARFVACAAACICLAFNSPLAQSAELVMFEEAGCTWCKKWDDEIGVVYERTSEGRAAPLRRIDIHADLPSDLAWLTKARVTPTFVLIDNGRDHGRIHGYPGENFFWPMLQELLKSLPHDPDRDQRRDIPDPSREARQKASPSLVFLKPMRAR